MSNRKKIACVYSCLSLFETPQRTLKEPDVFKIRRRRMVLHVPTQIMPVRVSKQVDPSPDGSTAGMHNLWTAGQFWLARVVSRLKLAGKGC